MAILEVRNIEKNFGETKVLKDKVLAKAFETATFVEQ